MRTPPEERFANLWGSLVDAYRRRELQRELPSFFQRFAVKVAREMGHSRTFIVAVAFVLAWLVSGPLFGFSTGWQLVIITGTTIVTFLMVFLIQNTQNSDSAALQVKVDELIRATEGAHNDAELDRIRAHYGSLPRPRAGMSHPVSPTPASSRLTSATR